MVLNGVPNMVLNVIPDVVEDGNVFKFGIANVSDDLFMMIVTHMGNFEPSVGFGRCPSEFLKVFDGAPYRAYDMVPVSVFHVTFPPALSSALASLPAAV